MDIFVKVAIGYESEGASCSKGRLLLESMDCLICSDTLLNTACLPFQRNSWLLYSCERMRRQSKLLTVSDPHLTEYKTMKTMFQGLHCLKDV
jgi:hypothetical protein